MGKKRAVQPVSFNLTDEYEKDLYEYALSQQKYFSRYVKRLIENDRRGEVATRGRVESRLEPATPKVAEPVKKIDKNVASGFL